ncbi:MAG: glycoside hydrolase family 3 C-terminal domain-containing protein [Clostridiales bacterium]|nr:glycoside hydrolase family 3 C-terminal domain-containing protein [Clostridiales bacterium]
MKREEARSKAQELVSKMTLEEKASQLRYDAPAIERLGIPAYNWWNEALHGVARAGQATVFPQAIGLGATFDTELIGEIADTISTEGRAKYNAFSSEGDRDIYKGLTFWSPNVNIFRDPRWGRGHETYGEDPYLTSRLGVAFVKGLQGDGETMKAAACAKHFAVHSGPEALRHEFDAEATAKDMEETYLPAFQALVKEAGVESVMGAYNRVNGEPACASQVLQKKLRGDWGFEGHFVSDCWAIRDFHENHLVAKNATESAALAINTGCDLNCGNTYLYIMKAYQEGLVTEETITEAAVRLFTTRYLLGLFDGSEYDAIPYMEVESPAHLALAQKAAEESFVLLKNNGILPLQKEKIKTIGLIGPNMDSRVALAGNYHGTASRYVTIQEGIQDYLGAEAQICFDNRHGDCSAAESGESERSVPVRVLTSVGCHLSKDRTESLSQEQDRLSEARIVAKNSDVVLLCVGLDETLEGEEGDTGNRYASGDKEDLQLPKAQRELMEAVAACGKPTVLLLTAGSDIDLSYAAEHFDTILDLWYPGCEGGHAAARVLFGDVSPSGKLPVTFYETLEELPEFTDYSMQGRTYRHMTGKAQYPFGYGLTYGDVEVIAARIETESEQDALGKHQSEAFEKNETGGEAATKAGIKPGTSGSSFITTVVAEVTNHGAVDTQDVVQVYVKNTDSADAVPNPQLAAFAKVFVKAGETRQVTLPLAARAFTVVDAEGIRRETGGTYKIYVGCSQPDEKSVELTGDRPVEIVLTR